MLTNPKVRAFAYQALAIVVVVGFGAWLIANLQQALAERNIATGFGFLAQRAGFSIGEGLVPFSASDPFWRAYAVGIANTLTVSLVGILGATVIGATLGLMRLSANPLVSGFARGYVEVFRNTPQLVQIIFWYAVVTRLPHPRDAFVPVEGVMVTNRGVYVPAAGDPGAFALVLLALGAGSLVALWHHRRSVRRRLTTGEERTTWPARAALVAVPTVATWIAVGAPVGLSLPALEGFRVAGGASVSPEFIALALGLALYIAAFIAEIVRAGIQAVPRGQVETAQALGLRPRTISRFVVFPQALRIMVPPATAQYVSLVKNSSLGVAIGYPELFNVNNTILTLSGRVLEAIAIMMAVYLTISLSVSVLMNAYNRAVQLKER
ncbi:amino acid ABC transporter permease [Acuticoccus sp.]|uniref:amino acid ABC transporter permease n=1 Tax=Acuticoccus sp. TaxID=1904378 RepID=UPI003B521233